MAHNLDELLAALRTLVRLVEQLSRREKDLIERHYLGGQSLLQMERDLKLAVRVWEDSRQRLLARISTGQPPVQETLRIVLVGVYELVLGTIAVTPHPIDEAPVWPALRKLVEGTRKRFLTMAANAPAGDWLRDEVVGLALQGKNPAEIAAEAVGLREEGVRRKLGRRARSLADQFLGRLQAANCEWQ